MKLFLNYLLFTFLFFLASCSKDNLDSAEIEAVQDDQVTYTFNSVSNGTDYQWDFGDGRSKSGKTVSHVFPKSGTYEVTLEMNNDDGLVKGSETIEIETTPSFILVREWQLTELIEDGEPQAFDIGRTYWYKSNGFVTVGDFDDPYELNESGDQITMLKGTQSEFIINIDKLTMYNLEYHYTRPGTNVEVIQKLVPVE